MILTLIVLVLVAALTAFLATQGTLTAILTFFSGAFAAVMAIGIAPALAPIIGGLWRADVGMGLSYLVIFAVVFAVLRIGSDVLVPTDVQLPTTLNRIGGGVVGLFASAVVIGGLLIGVFMLPLPEEVLGGGGLVEGDENGQVAANMPWPVGFTSFILDKANGGAQGGKELASVYPNLPVALASYRHTAQSGAHTALVPDQVEVFSWYTPDAATLKEYGIPTDKGVPAVVRTTIKNNSEAGSAADSDNYVRMTPQQVRLIAKSTTSSEYRQYNPIGFLDKGDHFVKLSDDVLNQAIVDDANQQNQIIHDWVFALGDGFTPVNIEIKEGGLASFEGKYEPKQFTKLAGAQYPPRKYMNDRSTIQVLVKSEEGALANATIWVLQPNVERRNVNIVQQAHTDIENKMSAAPSNASPGTLSAGDYRADLNTMLEVRNAAAGDRIAWARILVPIIKSRTEPSDGRRNISVVLPNYVEQTLSRVIQDSNTLVTKLSTGGDGMTPRETISPGTYTFFGYARTEDTFRVWVIEKKIEPKATVEIDMSNPTFKLSIR